MGINFKRIDKGARIPEVPETTMSGNFVALATIRKTT